MRLLLVSNRLPITVTRKEGQLKFHSSAGGLVSGLSSYLDSLKSSPFTSCEYIWVGWPGIAADEETSEKLRASALSEFRSHPVFLSQKAMDNFYHGFCNRTIWPLFHYFQSYAAYEEDCWRQYQRVNACFRDEVMNIIRPGDVVWIHDYHLMLLPRLIKEAVPNLPVGFFLHIPFPSYEIFRLLPKRWCREILEGLCGADLIGFHTHDYRRHFLNSVERITGRKHDKGRLMIGDRLVTAGSFPMGIDFERFHHALDQPEVQREREKLNSALANYRVILSIDRLDYSKGVINRLQGYEIFLENNPAWHGRVILVLVVVPSRIGVDHYQQMKQQIDEMVGRINGRFASIDWTPILYQYRFLPFPALAALYNASDVGLVTPLRDGMNLIAKEYIASRRDQTGVLILSETAGASKELAEAILINPNHREEIADALREALEMPLREQIRRNQGMQRRLSHNDVVHWAHDFIEHLSGSSGSDRPKSPLEATNLSPV